MKTYKILPLLLLLWLTACNGTYDFSYSPEAPKAGESVVFTNLSTAGDKWAWQFGDGSVSVSKSPSHIFKRTGTFDVTLMVDSSQHKLVVKQVTVYDTVPSFKVSSDSILYMTEVTLSALVYNPYSKPVTYQWTLPECAVITSGELTDESLNVYFTRPDTVVNVSLDINLNGTNYSSEQSLRIHDNPAEGLLMCVTEDFTEDILIIRQRLSDLSINTPQNIVFIDSQDDDGDIYREIAIHDDDLYIFREYFPKNIYKINIETGEPAFLLSNGSRSRACISKQTLYWTSGYDIYSFPWPMAEIADYSQLQEHLLWKGPEEGSIGDIQFVSDSVAYLQQSSYDGLLSNTIEKVIFNPATRQIVKRTPVYQTDESLIKNFRLDPTAQKLYIIDNGKLAVCSTDGTNAVRTDIAAYCLCLVPERGVLYFSDTEGVWRLPLVYNPQNRFNAEPQKVSDMQNVTSVCFDIKER